MAKRLGTLGEAKDTVTLSLADLLLEQRQAGRKEVVEWVEEYGRMSYESGKGEVAFNHVQWHSKLKEWGL